MAGIAILLTAAAAAYLAARALQVPPIPLLLVAGLALAATGTLTPELLEHALVLGVTFLLFITGIELAPGRMRGQRGAAIRVGVFQFAALGITGFAAARLLGYALVPSIYLALALTASSTLVGIRLLARRRQMFEPFGRLVIGVLLLQDLFVILLIPVVTRMPGGAQLVGTGLLAVAAMLGLTWAAHRWAAPALLRLDGDDEALLLGILALLFVFIGIADALRLPVLVGAFLAGVSLSRFPVSAIVRSQLNPINDFFSAVFFTALGALIGVPAPAELLAALVLGGVVVVATPPLVLAIAERAGLSTRPAIEAGLLLAQTSELSLVVGLLGMIEGQITASVFTVIALVTVATMLLTPFLTDDRVVWRLMRLRPVHRADRIPAPAEGHVLILGSGTTGTPLLETLIGTGRRVVVVDDDAAVVNRLRGAEIPCIRGDASDREVLDQARAREARLITSTIRRPQDNVRLLAYARGVPVLVRVFEAADARRIRELGGIPVLYSEATADAMLEWYESNISGT